MTRTRHRTVGASAALTGLLLAAGAATAAPAGATSEAGKGYETNRGAVVFNATYLGKADGFQGNTHEISIESEGDGNFVHSYYCPPGADRRYTSGCTLRSQVQFIPEKSDVRFWVSSTGLSATVKGELRSFNMDTRHTRDHDVDLTLRASRWTGSQRGILGADGTLAGLRQDIEPGGFLTLE